jgi:hypothetical protein
VEVTSTHGGVEVSEIAVLPDPHNLEDRPSFERNGYSAAVGDAGF